MIPLLPIITDTISAAHTLGVNYIDIPLNLTYKLPLSKKANFFLSAGPYIGLYLQFDGAGIVEGLGERNLAPAEARLAHVDRHRLRHAGLEGAEQPGIGLDRRAPSGRSRPSAASRRSAWRCRRRRPRRRPVVDAHEDVGARGRRARA